LNGKKVFIEKTAPVVERGCQIWSEYSIDEKGENLKEIFDGKLTQPPNYI